VVHHVTYVSARYPSFMGSLGILFCWARSPAAKVFPLAFAPDSRPVSVAGSGCATCPISGAVRSLMRRTFRQADRILVTATRSRWCRGDGVTSAKSNCDRAFGPYLFDAKCIPQRGVHTPRLLYVGRLLEWKGLAIALAP